MVTRVDAPPGTPMRAGTYLTSPNGYHRLTVQGDGNVVLTNSGAAVSSTRTTGTLDARLVLQEDGNLVVFSGAAKAAWTSQTSGYGVQALTLGDDGTLRLVEVDGTATWDSTHLDEYTDKSAASPASRGDTGGPTPSGRRRR